MAARRRRPLAATRARGAALIILMSLLAMGMLYFVTLQLEAVSVYQKEAQKGGGGDSLVQAREALLGYAATYRDDHPGEVFGYMPCPDMGAPYKAGITPGNGAAASDCGAAGASAIGLLPYKTLNLPDLRDSDGNCLWYAVSGNFKNNTPNAPLNWDTQGQFTIGAVAPEDAGGGAAIVIIAPGPALIGRRANDNGPCNADPTDIAAFIESYNAGTATFTPGAANTSNNDRLAWITPREIFDRVKGRNDFAAAINTLSNALVASLTPGTPGAPLVSHDAGDAIAFGSKLVGKFPAATNVPAIPIQISYLTYRDNWRDMYRYVRCTSSPPNHKCLTVNGVSCMGTLIFAGQKPTAGPRTTANKANDATYLDASNYNSYISTSSWPYILTGESSFAMVNTAQPATQDVLYCLNSPDLPPTPPTTITGTDSFAVAASSPLINSFATSGRLGTSTASGIDRSACTWSPTALDFFNGLSVYFKLTINTRDAGLTFTVADATNNTSTVNLCGGIGANGQYLGYAGTHSSGNRIKAPKIGLELDTRRDATLSSDSDYDAWQTFVPTFSLNRHAAIVHWGTMASNDDDNTHGAGTAASDTQPRNPSTAPGVVAQSFSNGNAYHVRLDIQRSYAAPLGTYSMTAYIYLTSDPSTLACRSLLSDPASLNDFLVNIDTNAFCLPTISNTITINDSLTGGSEAMKKVYLGFTNGQRAGREQNISIGNFVAKNH
jgi:hypothetical protein